LRNYRIVYPLVGEIVAYNIKTGLLLGPHFAVTAGYRGYKVEDELEIDVNDQYDHSEITTNRFNGLTLGMELEF
jgi:hypothetical protein